ncbi:uncharacterized protein HD556DRAFT_1423791 [Suillus plorans]|uniref:Restriction of telomere capping protein 1 n=1 Tax=Suillus plorans TaxID=116603 RepID=A0A9P7AAR6_9AGAM|nr:uncharacterized protein HD556DRAFT_1423791 [Suillus plorans]KAG1785218.1 hypothetical protein HD556DRAFT_1423791 [Suillus plorans]
MQSTVPRRASTLNSAVPLSLVGYTADLYSDSRKHGYQGPVRNVRLHRATTNGGGTIAKSDDGLRCVVAGRESLRILRLSDPEDIINNDHKASIGRGGHRIEASRNIWDGSGLKIDSASTDVAWCHGSYNNKILTSARNGDLIMWDLNRAGNAKYERKTKFHIRSIHKLSCSTIVPYYCVTGSADGDMRVWDLRDMSKSIMKIHHPTSVRSLVFSPCLSHPLQAVVGLDNGSIYRWDLQMGQRGQLDRLPVAHTGPILALDWCSTPGSNNAGDVIGADRSWIVSGGLDHTVKVWDLATSGTSVHIAHQPTYTLHPSFPVRRVLWRPEFPSEIALVSNEDFGGGSGSELLASPRLQSATPAFINASSSVTKDKDPKSNGADAVEIWDVRRGWIAKWTVEVSVSEGGVTDAIFRDSHALWVQHASGTFAQVDLRRSVRPIDAVPRVALSWNVGVDGDTDGTLAFVSDRRARWEVPYDDIHPDKRHVLSERKLKLKCLGDKPRMPILQTMGMYVRGGLRDPESGGSFEHLARKYLVESDGRNRTAVCKVNAEASIEAGSVHTAQVWLLLGSLLTDIIPEYIKPSPHSEKSHQITMHLTHSASAPAAIPTLSTRSGPHASGSTSKPTSYRAASSDSVSKMIQQTRHTSTSPAQPHISSQTYPQPHPEDKRSTSKNSSGTSASREREGERDALPTTKPPPNSRNLTPASSTSSSPRHIPTSLPPASALPPSAIMTPATTRRPSVLISTAAQAQGHVRRPSVYNRTPTAYSETPSTPSVSASDRSLRHVGEGALDDSDSSDGSENCAVVSADAQDSHSENERDAPPDIPRQTIISKSRSLSMGRTGPAHPSPLSRLAGQRWTEDEDDGSKEHEDDEASPSPGSTDTDGEGHSGRDSECSTRPRKVKVKVVSVAKIRSRKSSNAKRLKSRTRSATVAVLTASLPSPAQPASESSHLVKKASHSSIRTVTVGSAREQEQNTGLIHRDEDVSQADADNHQAWRGMTESRRRIVMEEEAQLREAAWHALREAVEEFAETGDVQMCAMLALIAAKELGISRRRGLQFLEAYIELLTRLRLHTCAAYLRKCSNFEDVSNTTKLETIIYTACGRCRKPILLSRARTVTGAHALCTTCKSAVVKCSICHLPVRTLLFQCSVCTHGGHQECYRRYHMGRPMVDIPTSLSTRGRSLIRERNGDGDGEEGEEVTCSESRGERTLAGHLCAAGCGHYCWATVGGQLDAEEAS